MNASLDDNVGVDICGLAGELQTVPAKVADQPENIRRHVIMRENDGVLLSLQIINRCHQWGDGRPLNRCDEIADQWVEMICLGFHRLIISEALRSGGCRRAQRGWCRTPRSGIYQSCHLGLLLCST